MGLDRDRNLGLARLLSDDTGLTFDFFLVHVVQNSFPNSPEARSHRSQ
jgi:hypothetical protein